jgi:hypothetical protein
MDGRDLFFILIAAALYWGLKWFYGKRDGTASDKPNIHFSWVAVVFALGLIIGVPYCGTQSPGSAFERDTYKRMFYVNLFPEGQTVKSYRVPAMVSATFDDAGYRMYILEFATMPNAGIIHFDDGDPLEVGTIVTVFDSDRRCWGAELTRRPARK